MNLTFDFFRFQYLQRWPNRSRSTPLDCQKWKGTGCSLNIVFPLKINFSEMEFKLPCGLFPGNGWLITVAFFRKMQRKLWKSRGKSWGRYFLGLNSTSELCQMYGWWPFCHLAARRTNTDTERNAVHTDRRDGVQNILWNIRKSTIFNKHPV